MKNFGVFLLCFAVAFQCSNATLAADRRPVRIEDSIAAATDFLASRQQEDGSISDGPSRIIMTALAALAIYSADQTQTSGRQALVLRRALNYLLASCPDDAYFGSIDGSGSAGQAAVMLALAEAHSVETDPVQRNRINWTLARATNRVLRLQQTDGGWGATRDATTTDVTTTAWLAIALHAAVNAGHVLPPTALAGAQEYLQSRQRQDGGVSSQPDEAATASATASADWRWR